MSSELPIGPSQARHRGWRILAFVLLAFLGGLLLTRLIKGAPDSAAPSTAASVSESKDRDLEAEHLAAVQSDLARSGLNGLLLVVRDIESGRAIAGAQVIVQDRSLESWGVGLATDAEGGFAFSRLPEGEIRVEHKDYWPGRGVALGHGSTLIIEREPRPRLTGRLVWNDGEAFLAEASVVCWDASGTEHIVPAVDGYFDTGPLNQKGPYKFLAYGRGVASSISEGAASRAECTLRMYQLMGVILELSERDGTRASISAEQMTGLNFVCEFAPALLGRDCPQLSYLGFTSEALDLSTSRRGFFALTGRESRSMGPVQVTLDYPGYAEFETEFELEPTYEGVVVHHAELVREAAGFGSLRIEFKDAMPELVGSQEGVQQRFQLKLRSSQGSYFYSWQGFEDRTIKGIPTGEYSWRLTSQYDLWGNPTPAIDQETLTVSEGIAADLSLDGKAFTIATIDVRDESGNGYSGSLAINISRIDPRDRSKPIYFGRQIIFEAPPYRFVGLAAGEYSLSAQRGGLPPSDKNPSSYLVTPGLNPDLLYLYRRP